MISALIRKELSEHGRAFVSLLVASLILLFLLIALWISESGGGMALGPIQSYAILLGAVVAPAVCGRLVVREYRSKTQLYLEALPLSRPLVLMVKYSLGVVVLALMACVAFAVCFGVSGAGEPLSPLFAAILISRIAGFTLFCFSFFFVTGFLGRYRIAFYALLVLAAGIVSTQTTFDFTEFGPFELIGVRFGSEREQFPLIALGQAFGAIFLLSALGFGLGLVREGSVATLLAERMSYREKLFAWVIVIGLLGGLALYEKRLPRPDFDLADAVRAHRPEVRVKVSSVKDGPKAHAEELAEQIAGELSEFARYLRIDSLPPVFVVLRRDLDPDQFERATLEFQEGVLVRSNFSDPAWSQEMFLEWLLREVLIARSRGRVLRESRQWILDGFPHFWVTRNMGDRTVAADRKYSLRALYGSPEALDPKRLLSWLRVRESLGAPIASALAWSGLQTLRYRFGDEPAREFLSSVLASPVYKDGRALFDRYRVPWRTLLVESGVGSEVFLSAWREELELARGEHTDTLAALPHVAAQMGIERLSSETHRLTYSVRIEPEPKVGTLATVFYDSLSWFDAPLNLAEVRRRDFVIGNDEVIDLPGTFSSGSRLASTVSIHVEALGCDVISGWVRRELP